MRQLCLEARKEAADFIHELCTFVDEFYQELKSVHKCSMAEAWQLVSQIVKQTIDELNKVRAVAREANHLDKALHSATLVVWVALCANRVQNDYMETKFRYHPSLAPIVNSHVQV